MAITGFTPLASFAGGCLIGVSALLLMAFSGRIAGITGILGGLIQRPNGDWGWRFAFAIGLFIAPILLVKSGVGVEITIPASLGTIAVGGVLVGFGTNMGSGCTSGHGVCGLARFSKRSLVAVLTFMASAILTVFIIRHGLGGK